MANLTTSESVDTFMQSADQAAMQSALSTNGDLRVGTSPNSFVLSIGAGANDNTIVVPGTPSGATMVIAVGLGSEGQILKIVGGVPTWTDPA